MAWKNVCKPKCQGGLNIIDIEVWNKINLIKLLWNLSGKSDSLWVKWIQVYYIKRDHVMDITIKPTYTWIMKAILNQRDDIKKYRGMEKSHGMEKI